MLAQNFKTPAELGIKSKEFDALFKVLRMLERDELVHVDLTGDTIYSPNMPNAFSMTMWKQETDCGTVGCIGGWAEKVGGVVFIRYPGALDRLFYPGSDKVSEGYEATPAQAAIALRSYLTTGEPCWAEAMAA
jgi:hypothetical protein